MLLIRVSLAILHCAGGPHAGDPAAGGPPDRPGFGALHTRYTALKTHLPKRRICTPLLVSQMPDSIVGHCAWANSSLVATLAGSILISFTTPITFYFYMRMVNGFDDSGYALTARSLVTMLMRYHAATSMPGLPAAPMVVSSLHAGTTTWSHPPLTTSASPGRTCRCPSPFSPPWSSRHCCAAPPPS